MSYGFIVENVSSKDSSEDSSKDSSCAMWGLLSMYLRIHAKTLSVILCAIEAVAEHQGWKYFWLS